MKQADVLQGLYFFEDRFDEQTLQENFAFHEPRTVHESSLSPCVHAVLAASLDMPDKAYEMYLQTARLDLDDYNSEVHQGLHITSMAGTWMAVVEGFGGLRVKDDILHLSPSLPSKWSSFSFHVQFRGRSLKVEVSPEGARATRISGEPLELVLAGEAINC
jgi:maltose phosphorylase